MSFDKTRRRVWGWFFFDWASQPYNTLLITFIFAPYVKELIGDGARAQALWAAGIAGAGIVIALGAPVLGALADRSGARMRWIWVFSGMYVVGASGIWWAAPGAANLTLVLGFFALGMIGMEFATIFTNSMLPDLGDAGKIGRISGAGWAFGYVGGLVALLIMLLFFAESASTGKTLLGLSPALGLDPAAREGTRFVGPLTAIWYAVFMVPFFLWVKESAPQKHGKLSVRLALNRVAHTLRHLPQTPSLLAYLASSMFYRDALNGMYFFGGIYAAGVLGWDVVQVGIFGILALVTGAVFAWAGGHADDRFGPKPVIAAAILALLAVAVAIVFVSRARVFWMDLAPGSHLPDVLFYVCGGVIGAAGGALQSASRTMMVRQARQDRMAESFGLYGLAGKATAFIAPALIGAVTAATGSQQIGVSPLIGLFLLGLVLLVWVKPQGDHGK
ncbi:MAG: MFS transporter [Rhodobacterales bacterium]|nr:MFS transporter [Rhodobacterales bacterium]